MNDDTKKQIQEVIDNNNIVLFMKGSPQMPQCGFSMQVANILHDFEAEFASVDVLQSEDMRQGIKEFSNWPTIPQLYVKGKFIGGCDIVKQMAESGELEKVLGVEKDNQEDSN